MFIVLFQVILLFCVYFISLLHNIFVKDFTLLSYHIMTFSPVKIFLCINFIFIHNFILYNRQTLLLYNHPHSPLYTYCAIVYIVLFILIFTYYCLLLYLVCKYKLFNNNHIITHRLHHLV